ncbi:MAG: AAA family ATPase [Acholeplasmatales bacterium]|nr:AAA family ATPase [Acholeplasmatales bacterium]
MNLDLLENQKNLVDFITNAYSKDRLTHAYIFEGKKGVGKNELAHLFACLLYSNNKLDLNSQTSKQILSDEHFNVFTIYPDGKNIKKDQIESLHNEFSKTSQIDGPRVYIINDADKMNVQSQNSLLKFIEEPQKGVYGILCTTNAKGLLPTILSRCQILRFNELDPRILEKALIKNGVTKEAACLLSYLTSDIDNALELNNDIKILNMFKMFNSFFNIKNDKDIVKYFNELSRLITDSATLLDFIKLLIIVYEDILYLYNGSINIKLSAYAAKINKLSERLTLTKAMKSIDYLYDTSKKLSVSNVSVRNVITGLMFNLM